MNNYTLSDLGFDGIPNIASMQMDKENKTVLPLKIAKTDTPIYSKVLIPRLMDYLQHAELRHENVGRVAAFAYFLDGHVEYALNNSTDRLYLVKGGNIATDFYKSDKCPEGYANNIEYVSHAYKNIEGVMVLQELPGTEDHYLFRIVHDAAYDSGIAVNNLSDKCHKGKRERKAKLLMSCMDYLEVYKGREVLSEDEIQEVFTVLHFISVLDPKGRYVQRDDDRDRKSVV